MNENLFDEQILTNFALKFDHQVLISNFAGLLDFFFLIKMNFVFKKENFSNSFASEIFSPFFPQESLTLSFLLINLFYTLLLLQKSF